MNRRNFLKSLAIAGVGIPALGLLSSTAFSGGKSSRMPIVTSWKEGDGYKTGLMDIHDGKLSIYSEADIPSRAHDVIYEGAGQWLIVDRIPGDWLARHSKNGVMQLVNIEDKGKRFAGHMVKSLDGKWLYTTEYEIATGQTIIGVRRVANLEKVNEYRTGTTDPHGLVLDAKGDIWVANGGIPKHIDPDLQNTSIYPVESAISYTDHKTGKLIRDWRVKENNLSIRHLAWGTFNGKPVLGGSIKSAHPTMEERENQPVLAVIMDGELKNVAFNRTLQGYAGDIAFSKGKFYLSCTQANNIVIYDMASKTMKTVDMYQSCALKTNTSGDVVFAGTRGMGVDSASGIKILSLTGKEKNIVLENHLDFCYDGEHVLV